RCGCGRSWTRSPACLVPCRSPPSRTRSPRTPARAASCSAIRRTPARVPTSLVAGRPDGHPAGPLHVDPAKLVVLLAGTGAHGHAVEADLLAAGITLEMADRDV